MAAPVSPKSKRRPATSATSAPATPDNPATPTDITSEEDPNFRPENLRDIINRLKRIEGQVRGLIDMLENGRSYEEVAQQMAAVRKAMDKAFYRMMACSVMEAITASESEINTFLQVERSTRILEKYA
ncbi:MAG: metal-sensitive transcriptional regulator [Hydrogenophaga sp.]|uniref:metal-sensitive transcriptional regulator n=1 Tax=Hydrogenophaga sp. TaxID=1904254 RepID=UPI002636671C|nr:metal-sensitive transcriptional regulator [Hydrogenophaga sp.]MCW5671394.1 metal-sensitive transcriptional regulator [Hydrogenophaga sp.]